MGKGGGTPSWARGIAERQVGLGEEALGLARGAFTAAQPYFQQAGHYFRALLQGGQAAQAAVAPAAENVSQLYAGSRRSIENFLPRGGERNLALATSDISRSNDLARLYAGVQPAAANALMQLGGVQSGTGTAFGGVGTSLTGQGGLGAASLLNYYSDQQQALGQGLGGLAQGAGTLIGMKKAAKVAAGACWWAFATFGYRDARAWRVRHWVLHRAPGWVLTWYRRLGPTLASACRLRAWRRISYHILCVLESRTTISATPQYLVVSEV